MGMGEPPTATTPPFVTTRKCKMTESKAGVKSPSTLDKFYSYNYSHDIGQRLS